MEFEVACINCIRNVLSDLLIALENAMQESTARKKNFIEHVISFNNFVKNSVTTKLSDQRRHEKYMLILTENLNEVSIELQAVKSDLNKEMIEHEKTTKILLGEIARENEFIEKIKSDHAIKISEKINKTEDEIRKSQMETEISSELLEADIHSRELDFEFTLKATNLRIEREFYKKRLEVEKGYLEALAKYDSEIGALNRTKENLTVKLNDLNDNLENFKVELSTQEVRYLELKQERELAILKAFTEDLENFKKNRAARVIQKAWRIFYERCCMRKKKKSKRKK